MIEEVVALVERVNAARSARVERGELVLPRLIVDSGPAGTVQPIQRLLVGDRGVAARRDHLGLEAVRRDEAKSAVNMSAGHNDEERPRGEELEKLPHRRAGI